MSNNRNSEHELTPMERAAIDMHLNSLREGIFSSQAEMNAALRHPSYHMHGSLGALSRALWEAKATRTQQHYDISGGNRVVDPDGGYMSAAATHRADGSIDSGLTSLDAPTGRSPEPGESEQHPNRAQGLPVLETLPGGTLRATYRSTDRVPKDSSKPATNRYNNVKGK
jgi:hypothetical protein